jgi:hypothetical protein
MFTTFISLLLFALFTAPGFYATVRIRGRYPAYDTAPTPWEQVARAIAVAPPMGGRPFREDHQLRRSF